MSSSLPANIARFEAFLHEAGDKVERQSTRTEWIVRIVAGALATAVAFGFFYLAYKSTWLAMIIGGGVYSTVTAAASEQLKNRRIQKIRARDPLEIHYQKLLEELRTYSNQKSLGERVHPAVAKHLESTSDAYFRVRMWLREPSSKNVLGIQMHQDVTDAVDRAMREVVFAIQGAYRPKGMQRKSWDKVLNGDPNAIEVCNELTKLSGLLQSVNDIVRKVETMGSTITLTDQLKAVREAIIELEQEDYMMIKSLPAPKSKP